MEAEEKAEKDRRLKEVEAREKAKAAKRKLQEEQEAAEAALQKYTDANERKRVADENKKKICRSFSRFK